MELEKVGVVGAGMMGSEIALVLALGGHDVKICDRARVDAERAVGHIQSVLAREVAKGRCAQADADDALARIVAVEDVQAFTDRELVVEAVFEDAAIKGAVFKALDAVLPAQAIIATNTSSISITALSGHLPPERRRRFIGTHFFSPVSRMKLVEVIPSIDSDEAVVARAIDLLAAAGKSPIRVKDVVGFVVNRVLHAFFIEAVRLLEEGAATAEDIDAACKQGLGHPVGPFELMDATKNSLAVEVQDILRLNYGDRFMARPLLRSMVQAGYNGKQAGAGWYEYVDGQRVPRNQRG